MVRGLALDDAQTSEQCLFTREVGPHHGDGVSQFLLDAVLRRRQPAAVLSALPEGGPAAAQTATGRWRRTALGSRADTPSAEVRPCLLVNDAERQWREMVPVTVKSNVPLTKSPRQSIVPWPVAPANRPVPPTTVYAPEIRYTPGVAVGQASSSTVQVS